MKPSAPSVLCLQVMLCCASSAAAAADSIPTPWVRSLDVEVSGTMPAAVTSVLVENQLATLTHHTYSALVALADGQRHAIITVTGLDTHGNVVITRHVTVDMTDIESVSE